MAREKRQLPDGAEWDGKRVRYCAAHQSAKPEFGTVVRMAAGKELAAFVLFDGDETAKLCYARHLEVLS